MRYHELMSLYKKNLLNETQKKQLEADIEKQEAISEYLFERDERTDFGLPENTDMLKSGPFSSNVVPADGAPPDFARMINRSIRKAFIKMGAASAAIALSGVLFVLFLLPKIVDCFYYDPGASTGKSGNQMSLDLAVYTELRIPGYQRDMVTVQDLGYGNYDIIIPQWFSYNDKMTNLSGRIKKGSLTLYDPNLLNPPVGNVFAWFQVKGDSSDSLTNLIDQNHQINSCAAGNRKYAKTALKRLDENTNYLAYVTLDQMMPYETFIKYLNQLGSKKRLNHVWCAVCTENGIAGAEHTKDSLETASSAEQGFSARNLGFYCDLNTSHALDWDREKYPQLILWDQPAAEEPEAQNETMQKQTIQNEALQKEDFAKTHFTSMLQYMADQKDFLDMMGDPHDYEQAAIYVEKNGLMVYGFSGIGMKETLTELIEDNKVYEIYTQELR